MVTIFGRFLRKLRIDKGEVLKDMAEKLQVSSAFLSAVENGKKRVPKNWIKKISTIYDLSDAKVEEMIDAIDYSKDIVEVNIKGASEDTRQVAVLFARKFESLDDSTVRKIQNLLNTNKTRK